MPKLVDSKTNQLVEVPHEAARQGFLSGSFNLPKGQPVVMVDSNGELLSVEPNDVHEAITAQGFDFARPEAVKEADLQARYGEGISNDAKALGLGAANTLTFGAATPLLQGAGFASQEELRELPARNPVAYGAGEVAGALAPIPGAPGLISKAGMAASEALLKTLPKATSFLGRTAAKAAAAGAGGAVEGALFGAGQQVSEASLGDPNFTAQRVISHIGLSSVLGGGLGSLLGAGAVVTPAAFGKAREGLTAVFSGIREPAENAFAKAASFVSGKPAEDIVTALRNRGFDGSPSSVRTFSEDLTSSLQKQHDSLHKASKEAFKHVRPEESASLVAHAEAAPIYDKLSQIDSTLQEAVANMRMKPELYPARFPSKLEEISAAFTRDVVNGNSAEAGFKALDGLKHNLDIEIKFGKIPSEESMEAKSLIKGLRSSIKESLEDSATFGEAGARQAAFNNAFSEFKNAQDAFQRKFATKSVKGINADYTIDPVKVNTFLNQVDDIRGQARSQVLDDYLKASQNYLDQIEHSYKNLPGEVDKEAIKRVLQKTYGIDESASIRIPKNLKAGVNDPLPQHFSAISAQTSPAQNKAESAAFHYAEQSGIPYSRPAEYVKVDESRAKKIADAYEAMPHNPDAPEVKKAYDALKAETLAQYQAIKKMGLHIELVKPGQNPYPLGPKQALEDMKKGHLWLFPTEQGFGSGTTPLKHPLLELTNEVIDGQQMTANDIFRVVHDVFGHEKGGFGFGPRGEENAWQSHVRMYSPDAARAMTTETRGQNSWVNFGPKGAANRANPQATTYAEQKAGLLPDWAMEGMAKGEAGVGHNTQAHEALVQKLKDAGFSPKEVKGFFGAPETSVIVPHAGNPTARKAIEDLGFKEFGQEAVLHSSRAEGGERVNQMVDRLGGMKEGRGVRYDNSLQDYYSSVDGRKFQLGIEETIPDKAGLDAEQLQAILNKTGEIKGTFEANSAVKRAFDRLSSGKSGGEVGAALAVQVARASGVPYSIAAPLVGLYEILRNPATSIQRLAKLEAVAQKVSARIDKEAFSIFKPSEAATRKLSGQVSAMLTHEDYEKNVKSINNDTFNADAFSPKLEQISSHLSDFAPNVAVGLQESAVRGVQFLQSKVPTAPATYPLDAKWKPGATDIAKFNRYYQVVEDPMVVYKQIKAKMLTHESIETLRTVYPDLHKEMQRSIINAMSEPHAKRMPYATQVQLSLFLGQDLSASTASKAILANQAVLVGPPPQAPSAGASGKKVPAGVKLEGNNRFLTPMQKSAQRN